jgi:hypothetical protein
MTVIRNWTQDTQIRTKIKFAWQLSVQTRKTKFHKNPSCNSGWYVAQRQTTSPLCVHLMQLVPVTYTKCSSISSDRITCCTKPYRNGIYKIEIFWQHLHFHKYQNLNKYTHFHVLSTKCSKLRTHTCNLLTFYSSHKTHQSVREVKFAFIASTPTMHKNEDFLSCPCRKIRFSSLKAIRSQHSFKQIL